MQKTLLYSCLCVLFLAFVISCTGGGNVVSPGADPEMILGTSSHEEQNQTHSLWGLWQVTINKETGTIEAVDMRSSDLIVNVLGFLEPPAMTGMSIDFGTLDIDPGNNIVGVDVVLKHPLNQPEFMGFDVRGVVFGPEVTNADGLTVIPSPEFFKGVPFGYQDGLLGALDGYANYEGLAGYKYFCKDLGKDDDLVTFMLNPANLANRGVFLNGTTLRRHYDLSWAETSAPITFLVFNYAIYANYNWPVGDAPIDIDDFDIANANSAESFCANVTETANTLWYSGGSGGGTLSLQVEVWDWQGDVNAVSAESVDPGVLLVANGTDAGPGSTAKSGYWDIAWTTSNPTNAGELDILITVTDAKTFGDAWFMGLLPTSNSMYDELLYNCFKYTTMVMECPEATPTGINPDSGKVGQAIDDAVITVDGNLVDGDSLAAALVQDGNTIQGTDVNYSNTTTLTADFDLTGANPGQYKVKVTNGCGTEASSSGDLFTVNTSGWAVTWGGSSAEYSHDIATDGSGNVYVAGRFRGTVDFDPSSGVDNHTSNGGDDIFLSKFDSSGNFLWARTWGGSGTVDVGDGVAVDGSGNVYVSGRFSLTFDFDPGSGVENHSSKGGYDVYLSKFDSSGNFLWAKTWGGSSTDIGYGVAADGSGNAYVIGAFVGTVDFDPGSGVDNHSSKGSYDHYLSKFDSTGGFLWAKTWGGSSSDYAYTVALDGSDVYVTGIFAGAVDFDPGSGVDNHSSNGSYDVFLSKFNSSGSFQWAKTWGGSSVERGYVVTPDGSGNVYIIGYFSGTVDFDPGAGVDNHFSNGSYDVFLSKFNSSGSFQWAKTWGGSGADIGYSVAADGSGNIYGAGHFNGTVDFDPGSGVDNHNSNGGDDVFMSKFNSSGGHQWAKTWGGSASDSGYGITVDGSDVYITGYFNGTVDFDPGSGVDNHSSNGSNDVFLSKFSSDGSW